MVRDDGGVQPASAWSSAEAVVRQWVTAMPAAPTYRCTGVRRNTASPKHEFTSVDAATTVGEVVWKVLGWRPDMTQFDVEVLVWVRQRRRRPQSVWATAHGLSTMMLCSRSRYCSSPVRPGLVRGTDIRQHASTTPSASPEQSLR